MNLTQEQEEITNYIKGIKDSELILVDSVAGSGKTTLLNAIAEVLPTGQSLYLAYNKAIATSSSKKFPSYVDCRTTHSLAYRATVKQLGLRIGFFGPKDIRERLSYDDKVDLVESIREFCLSSYLSYDEFAKDNIASDPELAGKYLNMMYEGEIEATHDFYLKAFHLLLASDGIEQVPYELVMLDEAGDLNQVTLEIFRLLEGRVKVAVGDPYQNIYTFNHTINCFEKLKNEGTSFKLSKSFRVPNHIAAPVEAFCKAYMDPNMVFSGTDSKSAEIKTRGYISRTNAGLIGKIVELNKDNTPYGLVRKAQEIFKVPLMVAGLKYQGKIFDTAYKHIQEDVDDWYENVNNIKALNPSMLGYLKSKYDQDVGLVQAISMVIKYGRGGIFEAYAEAKDHEGKKQDFTLLTAHSSKGLEFDEVILAPDMNLCVEGTINALKLDKEYPLTTTERESLNLYYVACTRALSKLRNAVYLTGV